MLSYIMIQLVVIDFDDTLCLTEQAAFELENETARRMGFKPMTREAHIMNWGSPLEEVITERILGINPTEFMSHLSVVHQEFVQQGRIDVISKENLQFLDKVKELGKKLALLTSRSLQEIRHLLDVNNPLTSRFEKFYHKDNLLFLKPDPRVFNQALTDFSIRPESAVYLGDSVGDGVSAKKAGLHFIAVLESGLRTKPYFKSVSVDFFAEKLPEAYRYISVH